MDRKISCRLIFRTAGMRRRPSGVKLGSMRFDPPELEFFDDSWSRVVADGLRGLTITFCLWSTRSC